MLAEMAQPHPTTPMGELVSLLPAEGGREGVDWTEGAGEGAISRGFLPEPQQPFLVEDEGEVGWSTKPEETDPFDMGPDENEGRGGVIEGAGELAENPDKAE